MSNERNRALIWLVILSVLVGGFLLEVGSGLSLKTDLMELFPASSDRRILKIVTEMMEGKTANKVLFLLSGSKKNRSSRIDAEQFVGELESSGLFTTVVSPGDRTTRRAYYDFYFPHRYRLLTPGLQKSLNSNRPVESTVAGVRRFLYGTTGPFVSGLLPEDPLLLFPRLMTHWRKQLGRSTGPGSNTRTMVVAQLKKSPYAAEFQRRFMDFLSELKKKYRPSRRESAFEWTGVIRFATTIRRRMRQDLRTIGMLSALGVILLIVVVFRSIRHLLALVGTLGVSIVSALTVLFWVWPEPHIFTIVFSTSLIGVSVDYAFHYFVEQRYDRADDREESALRAVFPGITIGMMTTVIGYLGLTLTPLPILKQMALFSSTGIIVAYGTVVCWYPYFFSASDFDRRFLFLDRLAEGLLGTWRWVLESRLRLVITGGVLLVLLVVGLSQLRFNDDVRYFENVPEALVENDRRLRDRTGQWNTGRFIVVEGSTPQGLLNRLESLNPTLKRLVNDEVIGDFRSLMPFLPSRDRQKENFELLSSRLLAHRARLRSTLQDLGIGPSGVSKLIKRLEGSPGGDFIEPKNWVESRVSFGLRTLWLGRTDRGFMSLVLLREISNEDQIRFTLADRPSVYYRNRLTSFNELFTSYRREAMVFTGLAYLLILLILILRYGPLAGAVTAAPSVGGGLLTVSILSLYGLAFNVTHVLALLLVLGIGIDYAVFLREGLRSGRDVTGTTVAIVLSALSTVFSFGFLGLSRAKMLYSIGMTVFVGIIVVLLLAPFVQFNHPLPGGEDP